MQRPVLYGFWASGSTWRTRIALNLRGVRYDTKDVDIVAGEQEGGFAALNPACKVPWLQVGDFGIGQSMAIIEWAEAAFPEAPPLFPRKDSWRLAKALEIAHTIASDTQPLQNLSVLKRVRAASGEEGGDAAVRAWGAWVVRRGLSTAEALLGDARQRGDCKYAVGPQVTIADVCLVPQALTAKRYGVRVDREFPGVHDLVSRLSELDPVAQAHPTRHAVSVHAEG